jgi:hypothetical protein
VRFGTTPQTPPGAAVALRLLKFFRDVSAAQLTATIVVFALLETAERQPRSSLSCFMDQRQRQESRMILTAQKPYG